MDSIHRHLPQLRLLTTTTTTTLLVSPPHEIRPLRLLPRPLHLPLLLPAPALGSRRLGQARELSPVHEGRLGDNGLLAREPCSLRRHVSSAAEPAGAAVFFTFTAGAAEGWTGKFEEGAEHGEAGGYDGYVGLDGGPNCRVGVIPCYATLSVIL